MKNADDCPSAAGIQNHSMPLKMGLLTKINVDHCDNFSLVLFTFLTMLGCETVKPHSFCLSSIFLLDIFLLDRLLQFIFGHLPSFLGVFPLTPGIC